MVGLKSKHGSPMQTTAGIPAAISLRTFSYAVAAGETGRRQRTSPLGAVQYDLFGPLRARRRTSAPPVTEVFSSQGMLSQFAQLVAARFHNKRDHVDLMIMDRDIEDAGENR